MDLGQEKDFVPGPWNQQGVEQGANMIIPVPTPLGGAILIGEQTISYLNGDKDDIKTVSMSFTVIRCAPELRVRWWWLGDGGVVGVVRVVLWCRAVVFSCFVVVGCQHVGFVVLVLLIESGLLLIESGLVTGECLLTRLGTGPGVRSTKTGAATSLGTTSAAFT